MRRHYGMDWLRIGAFQLLILYHVGMAFVPWDYQVKVSPPIDWATIPMFLTNPWRLSLLFCVSGFASAALLARSTGVGAFVRSRLARLGVPLLFGIVVVVTPQPWAWVVTHYGYPHGFGYFLIHDYYRFQMIQDVAMPTWMHLWFVVYLLAYTLLLALLMQMPAAWLAAVKRGAELVLSSRALLPLPIAGVYLARGWLSPGWEDNHIFWGDWSAHATYFPCFLFGLLLYRSAPARAAVARQWRLAGALAIAGWLVIAACEYGWPGDAILPTALRIPYRLARATEMWGAIIGLVGLAEAHGNRDHRWRPMLTEAVFPFYLIHQTIIIIVGYWLLPTPTSAPSRFVILVAATAGGCWAFYLIGRALPWLRPLIGLKRVARPAASATGARDELDADDPWGRGADRARLDLA